ncbi:TetR/AcrR family transcriptional regulator [Rhodococcus opacus]|nr:TetR/AcrR family transcriptional regulator [Rhodococcus opacus]RZL83984.1 MAG: TetR/AcrR family transcriptional regulator [Rhodococcus sp. (in: high G+C Gram-positive bacteria)]
MSEAPKAFRRAHSDEQRAQRREAILDVARAMLDEMRVASLSLNELSRRVGLAKSNVLRYFESREAVLLELLDRETREWLGDLEAALGNPPADTAAGPELVAATIATTVAARPAFCDLCGSAAGVLEHNVSADVAADYKHAAIANSVRLAELVGPFVGGLSASGAPLFVGMVNVLVGGVWAASQPSPGMAAAYAADPELAAMRLNFETAVREMIATVLAGLAHRDPDLSPQ